MSGRAGHRTPAWASVMLPAYAEPPLTLVRGEGATVWDDRGRSYVDLVAGIAVNVLGHAHPAVVEAVSRQVATLGHTSNLVANRPSLQLAERLLSLVGREGRVFFCNSGAEANETALKLARRGGRRHVVAAEGGFHGRTSGALSVTGQPAKRAPFEPLVEGVTFVPFGDADVLAGVVNRGTAAVFLEPVQGEAGVVMPPAGFLRDAARVAAGHDALLVLDEVQTGMGRTGRWFAHQRDGLSPDVMTLAKGLGGGLPIGATMAFGAAAEALRPGDHGSTFGGNPVACAAALAVIDTIEEDGLLDWAETLGGTIRDAIEALNHRLVGAVRGVGLMIGVRLTAPVAGAVERAARSAGFLVNATGPDVVRLVPPLVITDEQTAAFLSALPAVLSDAAAATVMATASDGRTS